MEKVENPACPDCGMSMRVRARNLLYAWFCLRCRSFDERKEIEIGGDQSLNNHNKNIQKIPEILTLTFPTFPDIQAPPTSSSAPLFQYAYKSEC